MLLAGEIPVPLVEDNEFRLTVENLEKAVTKRHALVMNYPSNSTGALSPQEDLNEQPVL